MEGGRGTEEQQAALDQPKLMLKGKARRQPRSARGHRKAGHRRVRPPPSAQRRQQKAHGVLGVSGATMETMTVGFDGLRLASMARRYDVTGCSACRALMMVRAPSRTGALEQWTSCLARVCCCGLSERRNANVAILWICGGVARHIHRSWVFAVARAASSRCSRGTDTARPVGYQLVS